MISGCSRILGKTTSTAKQPGTCLMVNRVYHSVVYPIVEKNGCQMKNKRQIQQTPCYNSLCHRVKRWQPPTFNRDDGIYENIGEAFDRIGFAPKSSALAYKRQLLYNSAVEKKWRKTLLNIGGDHGLESQISLSPSMTVKIPSPHANSQVVLNTPVLV